MAIQLYVSYVNDKPTYIGDATLKHPKIVLADYDTTYSVRVQKHYFVPVQKPFNEINGMSFGTFDARIYNAVKRELLLRANIVIDRSNIDYLTCDNGLVICRASLRGENPNRRFQNGHKMYYFPLVFKNELVKNQLTSYLDI